jgi:threonylcarbamoyladenosine tRNA methylthiotransferase MtaB
LVIKMAQKDRLIESVARILAERTSTQCLPPSSADASGAFSARTRALVKIQDGCDNHCAYCVVRIARGRHRSLPLSDIVQTVQLREAEGYKEIVLTGVNIGAYGRELGSTLEQLVATILAETAFPRLRLSSIEPWDMTPDLLSLWRNRRLCRHLHLPLQSGSDATLRRMNRRYAVGEYAALLSEIRLAVSDVAITTDVIAGFPGEDEREFGESVKNVARLNLARMHVFPFSARPGTPAAAMPHQVAPAAKKKRAKRLNQVARASSRAFEARFVGQTMDVLWESGHGDSWSGLTDNYLRVWTECPVDLRNRILPTRLVAVSDRGLSGIALPKRRACAQASS